MKSEKIPFRVADASGWEDGYPARDLELHSPWVKGWRAPKYCVFPQEVVLSLPGVMKLGTLQILSHQHLIATKVEVLVGQAREGRATVLPNAAFSRLGYVTFGDNHSNGYRTRELKSIPLDVACQFIKLRFHQNHINHLNPFNQVGVVALNVIGEPVKPSHQQEVGLSEGRPSHKSREVNQVVHSYLPGYHSNQLARSAVPTTDNLAFTIYQDPETGALIRHLQQQKEVAVRGEDFSRAKLLKQAIVDLQKVGEALAQFAVEKQHAVEAENYETAEECKERADRLRVYMYQQLNVFGLVEDSSVLGRHAVALRPVPATAGSESLWAQEGTGGGTLRPRPLSEEANDAPEVSQTQFLSQHGVVSPVMSREERPLPTLVNKSGVTTAGPREGEGGVAAPDKLSESALNEAALPIQIFGMELVECVYAKQFAHRERALEKISASLAALSTGSPRKDVAATAKAISILLRRLLADKMAVGFQTACALFLTLFDNVGQKLKKHFSSADIDALVSKTFPVLLGRLGDGAPRVVQQATETILEVLKSSALEDLPVTVDHLTEPLGKQAAWRAVLGRLILLQQVVGRGGVKGHLTAGKVMRVVRPGLEHANGQVRDAAVQLTLDLYQESPAEVRRGLPVDTPTLRKSLLWRAVMEGLDQIDGKPSSRQLKEAKQKQEKARMDELVEMQKELSGLRQLADQAADTSKPLSSGAQKEVCPSGPSPNRDGRGQEEEEHTCIFCGTTASEFAEEAQLNRHYLKYCVMLYHCSHCTQVVEIAALHEHWLTECKGKGKFRKCPRCKEAVPATQYPAHIAAKTCKVPSGNRRRCALCQLSIVNDDESWRGHLMGGKPCKNNPRKPQKS